MLKRVLLLTLCAQFAFTGVVFGWGRKGHDIIVEIATRHLTAEAQDAVDEILEGKSLVYYSAWMDQIRSMPEYRMTSPWHYINVNDGEDYIPTPISEGGDVFTAVEDAVEKLSDIEKLSENDKKFYLRSLIHFVGDMHCPMHAGHKDDRGGGMYHFTWLGDDVNLHSVWDSGLINSARTWSYTEWADNIDRKSTFDKKYESYTSSEPIVWMHETIANAKFAYDYTDKNKNLDSYGAMSKYVDDNYDILESQLVKGGYRLAYLLNKIFQ